MYEINCPVCGSEKMIVTEVILVATGEKIKPRSILQKDGFEFDLPEGIKDGSTTEEEVLCPDCLTNYNLTSLMKD